MKFNYKSIIFVSVIALFISLLAIPASAKAFELERLIDPLCLFACDDDPEVTYVTNTYADSNNVNSNINSPGASVTSVTAESMTTALPSSYSSVYGVYDYQYKGQKTTPPPAPTPVIVYNDNRDHRYSYDDRTYYPVYREQPVYYDRTVYYSTPATVINYVQPSYTSYAYYPALTVYCSANTTYTSTGSTVTWTAYPSGSNGLYIYSWGGTDGVTGSTKNMYVSYTQPGLKSAYVTVYSNGQSVRQSCTNYVDVTYNPYNTVYVSSSVAPVTYINQALPVNYVAPQTYNPAGGLDIGCYADPSIISLNKSATWTAEVAGGLAPYTYSWSGSDGLSGNQNTVTKYYYSTGNKAASLTVTSADGRNATKSCSNSVFVRNPATATKAAVNTITPQANDNTNVTATKSTSNTDSVPANSQLTAASLFSLANVPWGLVAILVILVLFATVMYLLFNRPKI